MTVEQLWRDNRLQSLFSNLLLNGDTMYLSRGYHGPSFLTAVDIKTGATRWAARGFGNANFLWADGKLIVLDEDGWLTLARPRADGSLEILSKAQVLGANAWTIPTLAGTTLYLRDRKRIVAFELGAQVKIEARENSYRGIDQALRKQHLACRPGRGDVSRHPSGLLQRDLLQR
jgi:hypothetical protein